MASKDLHDVSSAALRAELARRKADAKRPKPLPKPDFVLLVRTITEGVEQAIADRYLDEDFKSRVYEAAMDAVYGDEFWYWYRDHFGR